MPTAVPTPTAAPMPTPAPTFTPTPPPTPTPTLAPTPTPALPPPPAELDLNPFYEKYLDAYGLPIVSSSKVADEALHRAKEIIEDMLANRPDILAQLGRLGKVLAIPAHTEVLTDVPGYHDIYVRFPDADFDWNERHHGGGINGGTIGEPTVVWERNVICHEDALFRDEDILVHEFAHTLFNFGVERLPGGVEYRGRLNAAYEAAIEAGLWADTYASRNADEYWAEGVQTWFDLNDPPGPIHNTIDTRVELETYDPLLASLIREVFGDATVSASCHATIRIQGLVLGPNGEPLEGIGLWAWQGDIDNSGFARTGPDGAFDIRVPDGSFTLDVYTDIDAGCTFVGRYGPGGFTTVRGDATRIEVGGANVTGIEMKLPDDADQLPFIEGCS